MTINEKIKVTEDCATLTAAKRLAADYLKENGYDLANTEGYIYIVGPTVSDLLILKPLAHVRKDGKSNPKLRACTAEEWGKYFYTFVCDRERKG